MKKKSAKAVFFRKIEEKAREERERRLALRHAKYRASAELARERREQADQKQPS